MCQNDVVWVGVRCGKIVKVIYLKTGIRWCFSISGHFFRSVEFSFRSWMDIFGHDESFRSEVMSFSAREALLY